MHKEARNLDEGIVIKTEGKNAVVQLQDKSECATCGARMLCLPGEKSQRSIKALNGINARIGDRVMVSEKGNLEVMVAILQYGIPLLGFLAGIFGYALIGPRKLPLPRELLMFLAGILGLFIGGFFSGIGFKKLANSGTGYFYISHIISSGISPESSL